MRQLQDYKLNKPQDRYNRIKALMTNLKSAPVLEQWKTELIVDFTRVRGFNLDNPKIIDRENSRPWADYDKRQVQHA